MYNIEHFIEDLRNTDEYIKHIYSEGGCYRFHVLLSKMYEGSIPYINQTNDHIITKYNGKFYDIFGTVEKTVHFRPLTTNDLPMVEEWSFRKNNLLKLNECSHCEEPLTY